MLRISFDFDENTKSVSNITIDGIKQTRSRGVVTSSSPDISDVGPDIEVLDNKLQLSKSAMVKLGVKADDRLSIQYINTGIGKATPVAGKASYFTDSRDGNRISAKGTVAFRGEKHETLVEFGTLFTLEEYKDGIWKLIPFGSSVETENFEEEISDVENLNDTEINKEIEALTASIDNGDDDLPF